MHYSAFRTASNLLICPVIWPIKWLFYLDYVTPYATRRVAQSKLLDTQRLAEPLDQDAACVRCVTPTHVPARYPDARAYDDASVRHEQ